MGSVTPRGRAPAQAPARRDTLGRVPGRLVLGQWALGPIYVLGSGSSGGQLLALGSGRDGQESLVTKVWAALGWRCRGLKSLHIPRVPGHLHRPGLGTSDAALCTGHPPAREAGLNAKACPSPLGGRPWTPRPSRGDAGSGRAGRRGGSGVRATAFHTHEAPACPCLPPGVFPRFYLVSKQCVAACAFEGVQQRGAKSFLLIKPTPFLYVVCCQERLCNTHNPVIEENSEDKYKEVAGACDGLGGRVGLAALLTLASVLLDLWLP